jgi:hypothetical protein
VIRPDVLASDASAAQALQFVSPAVAPAPAHYKLFFGGAQHGPYSAGELAQRIGRGEVSRDTRIWNMQWNPKVDKWQYAGHMAELVPLFHDMIPDPHDDIPDPD